MTYINKNIDIVNSTTNATPTTVLRSVILTRALVRIRSITYITASIAYVLG